MTDSCKLGNKIQNSTSLCLFGTVPPPKKVSEEKLESYAKQLANSIKNFQGLDGVNVCVSNFTFQQH